MSYRKVTPEVVERARALREEFGYVWQKIADLEGVALSTLHDHMQEPLGAWKMVKRMVATIEKDQAERRRKGRPLLDIRDDLTVENVYQKLLKTRVCEVSGLPFVGIIGSPYIPSLDRIDAGGPYMMSNIRIVRWTHNRARNSQSEEDYLDNCKEAAHYADTGQPAEEGPVGPPFDFAETVHD